MALSTAQLERALTSRQLQLILLPTEQCNFRCTYCYEDFAIGRMREPVRRGVKSLITSRAAELHTLSTQWFGGEPLAAKDVVIDISRHIQKVCTDHPQLRYHGAMTTNAYLLDPQTLHELVGLGIRRYQISLDGWGAAHDETRRRADGKGTFERVWANLRAAKQLSEDFSILIRVHLQPRSIGSVERLLAEISEHFADDPRFDVFFMAISNWGGPNSQGIQAFSAKEGEQLMQSYQARWRPSKRCGEERSAPAQSGEQAVRVSADRAGSVMNDDLEHVCYATRPNSLLIRADGSVGKCTVLLNDERNKIGTLQADGTVSMIAGRLAPWVRGLTSMNPQELACPAKGLPKKRDDLLTIGPAPATGARV